MNNSQKLSRAYALSLLHIAYEECRQAGLKVISMNDRDTLVIKVTPAYVIRKSDEEFLPLGGDDE
jgi:hypothetical protein